MNKYLEKVAEIVEREELEKEAGLFSAAGKAVGYAQRAGSATKNFLKKDWEVTKARSRARTQARTQDYVRAKSEARHGKLDTTPSGPLHEVHETPKTEGVGAVRTFKKTPGNVKALANREKSLKGLRGEARVARRAEASQGAKKNERLTYTNEN